MFDYSPEADEIVEMKSSVPEVTPGAGSFNKLDLAQVCYNDFLLLKFCFKFSYFIQLFKKIYICVMH